jgi:hypothetical protein
MEILMKTLSKNIYKVAFCLTFIFSVSNFALAGGSDMGGNAGGVYDDGGKNQIAFCGGGDCGNPALIQTTLLDGTTINAKCLDLDSESHCNQAMTTGENPFAFRVIIDSKQTSGIGSCTEDEKREGLCLQKSAPNYIQMSCGSETNQCSPGNGG